MNFVTVALLMKPKNVLKILESRCVEYEEISQMRLIERLEESLFLISCIDGINGHWKSKMLIMDGVSLSILWRKQFLNRLRVMKIMEHLKIHSIQTESEKWIKPFREIRLLIISSLKQAVHEMERHHMENRRILDHLLKTN